MKSTRTIRWVLYHEPIHLFVRTAKAFSEELTKLTNGQMNVEVYTMDEYAEKFHNGVKHEPIALIQNDEVEMSQMQTNIIAVWNSPDFLALEMPFLFKDHDHATRVLDGEIGKKLLDSLDTTTPVHGLAFTYSGGYRVIASDSEIKTVEDLKGLKMITTGNPVMVETARAFGCEPYAYAPRDIEGKAKILENVGYSVETTLPRFEHEANYKIQKYITDTRHSMYLTSILISKNFWNDLSQEEKDAVTAAARLAAVREREESVAESDQYEISTERHAELGVKFNKLDPVEMDKMKAIAKPIYEKYSELFTPGLLDGILRA